MDHDVQTSQTGQDLLHQLSGTDPSVLAVWLMAVAHGIAVQAKAGFDAQKLQAVADQALAGWPVGN